MSLIYIFVVISFPGQKQAPNPAHFYKAERGNPVQLPIMGRPSRKRSLWQCGDGRSEEANAVL